MKHCRNVNETQLIDVFPFKHVLTVLFLSDLSITGKERLKPSAIIIASFIFSLQIYALLPQVFEMLLLGTQTLRIGMSFRKLF